MIKGLKRTFDSAAGLRAPHQNRKCGADENHPHHTSPDQRVKCPFDFTYDAFNISGPIWTIDFQVITMIT